MKPGTTLATGREIMNRRTALAVTTVALSGAALSTGAAVAQQRSLKDQLAGSWMLVSTETTSPSGAKRQFYGTNPRGIMILDAGGRYANVIMRPDRPKFKDRDNLRQDVPAAELGEAARAFAANFGVWSVNEADKTLIRRFEGALFPNAEGLETKASVSLAGDELKLSWNLVGGGGRGDEVWRRAK